MAGLSGPVRLVSGLSMSQVRMAGLSGPVEFAEGRRTAVQLDLLKLTDGGMKPVGRWSRQHGITITNRTAFFGAGQPNVTLLVTTIVVRPALHSPGPVRSVSRPDSRREKQIC